MSQPSSGMTPEILLEKLWAFVRSVWPKDRAHVALLLGSILLMIVPGTTVTYEWQLAMNGGAEPWKLWFVASMLQIPYLLIYFAGSAALYISFFPGEAPSRALSRWVYLPFASGWICIIAVTQHYATLYRLPQIERAGGILSPKGFAAFIHTCAMPALISAVAIGLITFADARLRDAVTTLPVRIAGEDSGTDIEQKLGVRRFIWTLLVPAPIVFRVSGSLLKGLLAKPFEILGDNAAGIAAFAAAGEIATSLIPAAVVAWAIGPGFMSSFRTSLRLPSIKFLACGVVFPFLAISIPCFTRFAMARIHWAALRTGDDVPHALDFLPSIGWLSLWMILPALVEEMAYRGYLQGRFISQFGVYCGIFLVGLAWGVSHFPLQFGRGMGPGAIAHGLMNAIYEHAPLNEGYHWIAYAAWGVLAFVLFRFWPPQVETTADVRRTPDDELQGRGGVVESPA
jgi:membrane protease YdiL (CAAX protease family)